MLTKKQAEQIVKDLQEKKIHRDEEILEYLTKINIRKSNDMLKIINAMLQHHLYFDFFIKNNFVNYAESNNKFVNLIVKLSKTKQFDHANSNLQILYKNNPNVADFLYEKLKKKNEYKIVFALGYLLGGIGTIEPIRLWKIIDENKTPSINEKISYVCALYVVARDNKIPKRFVDLLITFANHGDKSLRPYSINTLMMWFNKIKRIQNFFVSFAKQSDENKKVVLQNVTLISKRNEEFCIRILTICAKTNDRQLIDGIALALIPLAPTYPIEVLKIHQKWFKMQEFNLGEWSKSAARESGKGNIKTIEKFLFDWICKEKNKISLTFHLPHILVEIYKGKDQDLLRLLEKIDFDYKWRIMLLIETIHASLSQEFEKIERSESFLNSCNALLMRIAEQREFETYIELAAEKNPVIHTLALTFAIKYGKKRIPSYKIKKNLQYFPNMVSFFGKNKLDELIDAKPFHPLTRFLSQVPIDEKWVMQVSKRIDKQDELWKQRIMLNAVQSRYYPRSLLLDMDESFAMLEKQELGTTSIRKGILDENTFFQTLIELNVAVRFRKKYITTLQPPINDNKKLDVLVNVAGTKCLFEIYSPREDLRLKYGIPVYSMTNKIKGKILDKLNRQIKSAEGFGYPVVLIIDKSDDSSITNIEILDSLFGTYQWITLMNKETGEIVKEYPTRKKDSISESSSYGKIISAIILLNRDIDDNDFKVRLYGETFLNLQASIPLDEEIIQKIEDALFSNYSGEQKFVL